MKKSLIVGIVIFVSVIVLGVYFYLQQEEYCGSMSLSEAKEIVLTECGGIGKDYYCNRDTGTWWVDVDLPPLPGQEGCNPACVINVETKEAEINWRCTGAETCAEEGETFSRVSDKHLDGCCEGLKEWPIPDTRFSIADICYEVGQPSEILMKMCIKCGDGICGKHLMYDENPCNCPEDCKGKNKSMFQSIEEFCQSNDWKISLSKACEEQETIKGSPICELC